MWRAAWPKNHASATAPHNLEQKICHNRQAESWDGQSGGFGLDSQRPQGPTPFLRWTFPRGHKVLPPPPALTFPGGPKVTPLRPPPIMALPGCSPSVRPPGSSWVLPGPSCAPLVPVGSFCLGPPGSLFLLPAATKMIRCCLLRFARIHWSLEAAISRQKATEGVEHSAARQIQGLLGAP